MILPVSMFVWERIYWLYFFQFSWRFLILAAFASSILAGGWVYLVKNNKNIEIEERNRSKVEISDKEEENREEGRRKEGGKENREKG